MNHQVHPRADIVYRRTTKGQAAALPSTQSVPMNEEDRRLLLLVNGFTSLDVLARVGHFSGGPEALALSLQSSGLIEETQAQRPEAYMRAPWREPPNQ